MGAALAALLLGPLPAGGQDRILSWTDTVTMEHEDRLARLRSLAGRRLGAVPRIETYRIDPSSLPRSIPVAIPISRWVFDQKVFFDTASDVLRPEGQAVIDVVAEVLRGEAADTAVFVAGHTDSRSEDDYNYALSVRRARSVALALHARKVRQAQIWQVGFGEAIPLAPNTSEAGMARNRRVEFLFGRKAEAVGVWLSRQRDLVCLGASEAQREVCLAAFERLPGVVATPVQQAAPVAPPPLPPPTIARAPVVIEDRVFVPIEPRRTVTAPASPTAAVAPPPVVRSPVELPQAPPAEVTIARNTPVLIDLREQRVLVETLER
ncbi:OmpA family protein [Methylobacterium sp. Leaf118]|uniref:OmpA family protein n=1 Tax=Methylobacterium sp. Leaf118 TaxID=2876562 RepID=UPI001E3F0AF7|nr:OmpA family protein [Methylobacterium sp. Leaf118]